MAAPNPEPTVDVQVLDALRSIARELRVLREAAEDQARATEPGERTR